MDIIFLAGTEGNPTCKVEEQDKIYSFGLYKENRGNEVYLEIQSDKNLVSISTSDFKWVSVCNNITLVLLASLDFKMESSGATAMPMTVVVSSTISFLIVVCIVITVVIIVWRKKDDDERINENQLNEINELRPGENDTYDTYAYDYDTYAGEMKTEGDYDCYYTQ